MGRRSLGRACPTLRLCLLSICAGALLAAGCGAPAEHGADDDRLRVFAGIPPLAFLVKQIGGDHVAVATLVQAGQDPHTFEPTPQQVLSLSKAAIFFKIDMPFENALLDKVRQSNPKLCIVDATGGIAKREVESGCCHDPAEAEHQHEHEDEHNGRGERDPHVWLSPPLLVTLADNIAAGLCEVDPAHASEYHKNRDALVARFEALHGRVSAMLSPYRGRSMYVFHPGFGYFADAYGLKQVPVESGGRSPTVKELRVLTDRAKADGVTTIFVQPQTPQHSARVVAEAIGGKLVTIDGLAENVPTDIEDIAEKVASSFREGSR